MPKAVKQKTPLWVWLFLALLLGGIGFWIFVTPFLLCIIIPLILLVRIQSISVVRQRRRMAASRSGESICQFARSFKRRTDTWILRAVYEEISQYFAVDGRPFPIRADDNHKSDLYIHPEDLDDMAIKIASRSGRSMEDAERNPFYGDVHTVRDIVLFLENQSRISISGRIC